MSDIERIERQAVEAARHKLAASKSDSYKEDALSAITAFLVSLRANGFDLVQMEVKSALSDILNSARESQLKRVDDGYGDAELRRGVCLSEHKIKHLSALVAAPKLFEGPKDG